MTNEQIIELAKQAGMEVHPRKMQIRVGADAALGLDSTAIVTRFAELVRNATLEESAMVAVDAIAFNGGTVQMEAHVRAAIDGLKP